MPRLLEARSITKRFPGVTALDRVSFDVRSGEIHAVIGENGAGKSTLMKILAGVLMPDAGELHLDGAPIRLQSVRDAQARGIALIHQELALCDNLSVAANIVLGREPRQALGRLDFRKAREEARRALALVGLDVDPRTPVADLAIGLRQMVEIAKALAADARFLIMDEPTSSLSTRESAQLFDLVRDLAARDVGVVYISHRMREVEALASRVTALRDGRNAGSLDQAAIGHDSMTRLMVGREIETVAEDGAAPEAGPVVLAARGLRTRAHPDVRVDLSVRAGEIVGLGGLVGAGRTELLRALFGADPRLEGSIEVGGREVVIARPGDAMAAGLGLVPEDRKAQGLVLDLSVRANLALPRLAQDARRGHVDFGRERELSRRSIAALGIRCADDRAAAGSLSGGNQQKIVIGKWLAREPKVLLLDEPTRGVDVGAKREIWKLLRDLARRGVGILFVSSEMEELLLLAHRVLVMHDGRIAGALEGGQKTEDAVIGLATGRPGGETGA